MYGLKTPKYIFGALDIIQYFAHKPNVLTLHIHVAMVESIFIKQLNLIKECLNAAFVMVSFFMGPFQRSTLSNSVISYTVVVPSKDCILNSHFSCPLRAKN